MHITIRSNVCVSESKRTLDFEMLLVVKVLEKSAVNKSGRCSYQSVFEIKDIPNIAFQSFIY